MYFHMGHQVILPHLTKSKKHATMIQNVATIATMIHNAVMIADTVNAFECTYLPFGLRPCSTKTKNAGATNFR